MDIGTKIRKMREAKGLSQENMAHELNMTQAGYGKIERNEVSLKYSSLVRIAEVLETSVENIIGYDEKVVFSNFYPKISNQINNLILDPELKKLYEEKVKLQQDKIVLLEEKIALLEEKLRSFSLS